MTHMTLGLSDHSDHTDHTVPPPSEPDDGLHKLHVEPGKITVTAATDSNPELSEPQLAGARDLPALTDILDADKSRNDTRDTGSDEDPA